VLHVCSAESGTLPPACSTPWRRLVAVGVVVWVLRSHTGVCECVLLATASALCVLPVCHFCLPRMHISSVPRAACVPASRTPYPPGFPRLSRSAFLSVCPSVCLFACVCVSCVPAKADQGQCRRAAQRGAALCAGAGCVARASRLRACCRGLQRTPWVWAAGHAPAANTVLQRAGSVV
jgi:hypothetical protein